MPDEHVSWLHIDRDNESGTTVTTEHITLAVLAFYRCAQFMDLSTCIINPVVLVGARCWTQF